MMIGFVSGLGVFDQKSMVEPKNQFTNVGLTDIQNDVQNFGGINDSLQGAANAAAIGWATVKIAIFMVGAVFLVAPFLIQAFPYVPSSFFWILNVGIIILYVVFVFKYFGKSSWESDF